MKLEFKNSFFFSVNDDADAAGIFPFVVRTRPVVLKLAPIHGGGGGIGGGGGGGGGCRCNEPDGVRFFYIVDDL